jgi:hypothetical protein
VARALLPALLLMAATAPAHGFKTTQPLHFFIEDELIRVIPSQNGMTNYCEQQLPRIACYATK